MEVLTIKEQSILTIKEILNIKYYRLICYDLLHFQFLT